LLKAKEEKKAQKEMATKGKRFAVEE